jgi:hypothetical protein
METEVRTPLVAPTDPKVSTTPSSNRFAFTRDASGLGITKRELGITKREIAFGNLSDGSRPSLARSKLQIGRHADVPRKRGCPS